MKEVESSNNKHKRIDRFVYSEGGEQGTWTNGTH